MGASKSKEPPKIDFTEHNKKTKILNQQQIKIILIGDQRVGKSQAMARLTKQKDYSQSYSATIGVDYNFRLYEHHGDKYKITFWDATGNRMFKPIIKSYFKGAAFVCIMFDASRKQTLWSAMGSWYDFYQANKNQGFLIAFLIGCKTDLGPKRVVSATKGRQLAQKRGMGYHEISAKKDSNCQQFFQILFEQISNKYEFQEPRHILD